MSLRLVDGMKRICLFILVVFLSFSLQAQLKVMEKGKDALLVTNQGDSLWGKAELDLENKVVQIRGEQGFRVIDLPKVETLRLYDSETHAISSYRRYYLENGKSELLEQVVIGSIHFLRKAELQTYQTYTGTTMLNQSNEVTENQYFMWSKGELTKVKNFKKQLTQILTNKESELIEVYRKSGNLKYYKDYDQALLVDYVNVIRESPVLTYSRK